MKKTDVLLKEYFRKLSDDTLKTVVSRSKQNLEGDRAVVVNILETDKEVDQWLSTASDADEFFDMLDMVAEYSGREQSRRYSQ